jgi:hypothetical protein
MRARIVEHFVSVVFVGIVLGAVGLVADSLIRDHSPSMPGIDRYLSWTFVDFGNPMHRELFRESVEAFPEIAPAGGDSLLAAIETRRREIFIRPDLKTGGEVERLSRSTLLRVGGMYAQFILVYALVLLITYQTAQAIAMYRFIRDQRRIGREQRGTRSSPAANRMSHLILVLRRILLLLVRGVAYAFLFAPAYVIAYTMRSKFETDTLPFMVGLGVISNGLLIAYANKLYTLLVSESHRGYVQTAVVKNLHTSYEWGAREGISRMSLLAWRKRFPDHIFNHIYQNAHFQWLPTLKEHGAFLVTGLIIIEMALNIQGRLCYELLQQILYRNFPLAVAIIFAIFLVVKATELGVDVWTQYNARRYDNAP